MLKLAKTHSGQMREDDNRCGEFEKSTQIGLPSKPDWIQCAQAHSKYVLVRFSVSAFYEQTNGGSPQSLNPVADYFCKVMQQNWFSASPYVDGLKTRFKLATVGGCVIVTVFEVSKISLLEWKNSDLTKIYTLTIEIF